MLDSRIAIENLEIRAASVGHGEVELLSVAADVGRMRRYLDSREGQKRPSLCSKRSGSDF